MSLRRPARLAVTLLFTYLSRGRSREASPGSRRTDPGTAPPHLHPCIQTAHADAGSVCF